MMQATVLHAIRHDVQQRRLAGAACADDRSQAAARHHGRYIVEDALGTRPVLLRCLGMQKPIDPARCDINVHREALDCDVHGRHLPERKIIHILINRVDGRSGALR